MRIGTMIAVVVLVGAAIWFAPRAGPPPPVPEFVHDRPTDGPPPPIAPREPERSPDERPPGFCDLSKVYDLLPRDEYSWTFPDEAARKIREYEDLGWRWVAPEVFEHASRLLLETIDHSRRLGEDRAYRDAWRIHTNVRLHPVFGEMRFVVEGRPPWVLYVEQGPGAEEYAARVVGWLDQLSMAIRAEFDLPPISGAEREIERVLKVMVFRDRKSFHEYYTEIGRWRSEQALSVYDIGARWSLAYREKGRSLREEARALLVPATHQLLHFHTKLAIQRARPGQPEITFEDRRVHSRLEWFRMGLVRMLSTAEVGPDGRLAFFRVDPGILDGWRKSRREGREQWSFDEFLRLPNRSVVRRRAQEIGLHPMVAGRLIEEFSEEACALTWFFRETKDEEIRAKYRAYLALELSGESGYREWKRIWGKEDDDWSDLKKKFEAWLVGVWKEK